jgi:hypothetical protein
VEQEFRDECRQLLLERVEELRLISDTVRDQDIGVSEMDVTDELALASATSSLSGVTFRLKRHIGSHCRWEASISEELVDENLDDQTAIAEGARFMRHSWATHT